MIHRFHRMAWVTLGMLGATGCVHTVPIAERRVAEAEKCQLVQSVLKESVPSKLVQEIASEGREEPAPVVVYVRRPEQSMLERFFEEDQPLCGDGTFQVVQASVLDAVVVYLQEVQDGYAFDVRRAGPEELSMDGTPQGTVKRAGAAWVSSAP
jgi:hypothetical protein